MRRVDVGELAEAEQTPGRRLLGAFASTADDNTIQVKIARRDLRPLPAAIVQRAELVTLVSTAGVSQSAARYLLQTKLPFLAIRFPPGASLWSVSLNGNPVKPRRRGDQIVLSLQTDQAGNRTTCHSATCRSSYEAPVSSVSWVGQIRTQAPQLWLIQDEQDTGVPVPQVDLVWYLHLPTGYRVSRVHGTVFTSTSDLQPVEVSLADSGASRYHRGRWYAGTIPPRMAPMSTANGEDQLSKRRPTPTLDTVWRKANAAALPVHVPVRAGRRGDGRAAARERGAARDSAVQSREAAAGVPVSAPGAREHDARMPMRQAKPRRMPAGCPADMAVPAWVAWAAAVGGMGRHARRWRHGHAGRRRLRRQPHRSNPLTVERMPAWRTSRARAKRCDGPNGGRSAGDCRRLAACPTRCRGQTSDRGHRADSRGRKDRIRI